jgi:hypothetical protein
MTALNNTLVDAVVTVARADERRWARFRSEQSRITHYETDYAAERALRYWFDPSLRIRAIDGWVQQFILDFCTEALHGRCHLTGFVGLKELEVPSAVFTSTRMITAVSADGAMFFDNELRLPDGTLVIAVRVRWVNQEPCKREPLSGEGDERAAPAGPSKKQLQALYDARVTNDHVPTILQDQEWAKEQKITRKRVQQLRRSNSDLRLHQRGPRSKRND